MESLAKTRPLDLETTPQTYKPIDFSHLPLQPISLLLRRLAKALLTELLETPITPTNHINPINPIPPINPTPPTPPITPPPPPDILKYLLKEESHRLTHTRLWKLTRYRPPLKKLARRAIAGKINAKQWQIAANNYITLGLGGSKGNGLPDPLWGLAGLLAWQDPLFKLWVTQKISQRLRQTELLAPSQPFTITLSPNTFWVLISLMSLQPKFLNRLFSPRNRARVRLARGLKNEGLLQIRTDEWAGFWDQWLIQRATERWPAGFALLDRYLCKNLLELPLLNIPLDSPLYGTRSKKIPLWQRVMETWFDMLDHVKRGKKPLNDSWIVKHSNFCAPDWVAQTPLFFSPTPFTRLNKEETHHV